ncbi:MAG: adenylyltransferase/cytidyltransferase family protein [Candidatus Krumholzibacteria bacterium]|nr:adenylyltransferase/cytidyltransferase family protein [Candidatus Krumholzibacteria bacterium]
MRRFVTRDDLAATAEELRHRGVRVVFTNGCFDLLHPGHIRLISKAAAMGDRVMIAINDDASVRRLKGDDRPIYPVVERAEILLALRWVDYVTAFPEDTPLQTIRMVRPDVLVKGGEYRERDIVGATFVRSYGGRVARVTMKKGFSTRLIVRRVSETG